jgi:DNA repair ATPase RecN
MTIAQALKEKNKKVALIQKLWQRIQQYNSLIEGSERPYSSGELYESVKSETLNLVELKTKIHKASAPVRKDIFTLSELKNYIQRVRSINTTQGAYRDRYDSTPSIVVAELDIKWQDDTIEEIEEQIEKIQEKLDQFNHTTHI